MRFGRLESDQDFAQGRSFGPRSTPCVDGSYLYAVGASGKLHCLETNSGKSVWSFNIYEKYGMRPHGEGLSCSPQIDGSHLIVAAGTAVFAFNKTDGKLVWQVLEERMNHSTPTFATLDGRKQLVVLTGSNLVGLDPESGRELWRHPQRGVNCATPVVGPNDQIFTAAAYGFGCQLTKIADGEATAGLQEQCACHPPCHGHVVSGAPVRFSRPPRDLQMCGVRHRGGEMGVAFTRQRQAHRR